MDCDFAGYFVTILNRPFCRYGGHFEKCTTSRHVDTSYKFKIDLFTDTAAILISIVSKQ